MFCCSKNLCKLICYYNCMDIFELSYFYLSIKECSPSGRCQKTMYSIIHANNPTTCRSLPLVSLRSNLLHATTKSEKTSNSLIFCKQKALLSPISRELNFEHFNLNVAFPMDWPIEYRMLWEQEHAKLGVWILPCFVSNFATFVTLPDILCLTEFLLLC